MTSIYGVGDKVIIKLDDADECEATVTARHTTDFGTPQVARSYDVITPDGFRATIIAARKIRRA